MNTALGTFVTLEGGEGAGKTTNLAFVRQWLERSSREVIVTREPGGTELGERLRELLLHSDLPITVDAELLMIFAARADHLRRVVEPALSVGKIVVCDRFTDATYAYQGAGRGVDSRRIAALEQWVQGGLRPDLTLLFDIPARLGIERANRRGSPDRFEQEQIEFFERIRQSYLAAAAREPKRIYIVDATRNRAEVETQLETILGSYFDA